MNLKLALCIILACIAIPASAADPDELQRRFLYALALVNKGQPSAGVEILKELYEQAPTDRIRLELARALFLAGDLKTSRQLFVEAYRDTPPADVRANITRFIEAIDRVKGRLSVGASVAYYANPLQQPGTFEFVFAGIGLTFEPDEKYRNAWGINGTVDYQKEFKNGLNVAVIAGYRELPGTLADRFVGDASIGRSLKDGKYEIRAGVFRFDQPNQSFTIPSVQAAFNQPLGKKTALRPTVRLGYFAADIGAQASGVQVEGIVPLIYAIEPSKIISIGPTITRQAVGFPEQSFTSFGVRAGATLKWERINLEFISQARFTPFDALDPFWGVRREDKGVWGSVVVSSDTVRLGPLIPSVGVICDFNRSTVRFFEQNGCDTIFELRKAF